MKDISRNKMSNSQTRATKRYQEKNGLISKSYKLKRELTNQFKEACERAGVSQAEQIAKMMKQFIDEHPE